MQQHDGIINGQRQLQDSTDREGNEGHIRKKEIGSHIDQDGERKDNQEKDRLEPGVAGQQEHQYHDGNSNNHNAGDLGSNTVLHVQLLGGGTADPVCTCFGKAGAEALNQRGGITVPQGQRKPLISCTVQRFFIRGRIILNKADFLYTAKLIGIAGKRFFRLVRKHD